MCLNKAWLHGEGCLVIVVGLVQPVWVQPNKVAQVVVDIDVARGNPKALPLGHEANSSEIGLHGDGSGDGDMFVCMHASECKCMCIGVHVCMCVWEGRGCVHIL